MSRGHSHGGAECNCQQTWEAAFIPGHPINQVARRNGIPQHLIGEWLHQLYQEMRHGSASPWDDIIEEWEDAVEASGLGEGGSRGHGGRRTPGGTRRGTPGGTRRGGHGRRSGHGGHGSHLRPSTGGRTNGTRSGRRSGRAAPTETSQSNLDPREAAQRERRQRRARAERRDQAEMQDLQAQMGGMGMGGGRLRN
ncbi:MAG: hypothetical protein Q9192_001371 [Flavoplaca navasiana]